MSNPTQFSWVEPTVNTDGTPVAAGEITGYQVGVRPASGTPGTYPDTASVSGATTLTATIASVNPALLSGSYAAAVRAIGPTDSAWSAEITFAIAGVPTPPTGFTVN
jgi:hypothetical protein